MRNKFLSIVIAFVTLQCFTGCGENNIQPSPENKAITNNNIDFSKLKDGTYTANSSRDDKLGISQITISIENHKIIGVEFVGYDLFGNAKGDDYGSLTGKDSGDYKKAQIAVKANSEYAKQLLETQSLDKVDAISGATISYDQFIESANTALNEAAN